MGDKLDFLPQIVRIAATGLLALLWFYAVWRCTRAVFRLHDLITRMKADCQLAYPEEELHPLLRKNRDNLPAREVTAAPLEDEAGSDFLSRFPDPEEEKQYPYYRRTGQIVCNLSLHDLDSLRSGGWYGFPQWTQDMLAGRIESDLLVCPDTRDRR